MATINMPSRQAERDPLDLLVKGLGVATSLYGMKADIEKAKMLKEQASADRALKTEAAERERKTFAQQQSDREKKQAGIITPVDAAGLVKDFAVSRTPVAGAQELKVDRGGGNVESLYILPKKKEVDPMAQELAHQRLIDARRRAEEDEAARKAPGFDPIAGYTPTKDDAKAVKDLNEAKERMNATINSLRTMVETEGSELIGQDSREMEQLVGQLKLQIKDVNKLGQLTGGDFTLIDSQVVDPTSFGANFTLNSNLIRSLDSLAANAENSVTAAAKARGFVRAGAQRSGQVQANSAEMVNSIVPVALQNKSRDEQLKAINAEITKRQGIAGSIKKKGGS